MKASLVTVFAILVGIGTSMADVPSKPADTKYSTLWSNSPFTSKPPPEPQGETVEAFADWTLGGVSSVEGGYMITLLHKKNAGETQIIRPRGIQKTTADKIEWLETGAPGTFKLDKVEHGKGGWKDISVHLTSGGKSGVVRFDDKNLVPKASGPAPVGNRQGQPGQPGVQPQPGAQPQPGQQNPNPAAPGVRQPRQRVLPPAAPQR